MNEHKTVATEDARTYSDVTRARYAGVELHDQLGSLGMNQRIYAERAIRAVEVLGKEVERLRAINSRLCDFVFWAREVSSRATPDQIHEQAARTLDSLP